MARTPRPSPDLLGLRAVVRDPASRAVLLTMVGADLVLIALHLSAASRGLEASLHYVDLEYGRAESLQRLRWLWCLGLLGLVVVAGRRWAFASRSRRRGCAEAARRAGDASAGPGRAARRRRGRRARARRRLVRILALVGLIAPFGVAVDAVHALAVAEVAAGDALGVVEDGGEMVGASALVAYLFLLAVRGPERIGRDRAGAARVAARDAVPGG